MLPKISTSLPLFRLIPELELTVLALVQIFSLDIKNEPS